MAEHDFHHIKEISVEYQQMVEEGTLPRQRAVPTGILDLDRITGGLQRSELIVLGGVTGIGKTALALQIATNAALENYKVAFFSLDAPRQTIFDRLLSMSIRNLPLTEGGLNTPLYITDPKEITMSELQERVSELHDRTGIDLLIIDYVQLINAVHTARGLKLLARKLDIPVLAISQLTRAVERRAPYVPKVSDLPSRGNLDYIADVVMLIYREDMYYRETERRGLVDVYIAKHRNGPTGLINLLFLERNCKLVDLTIDYKPDLGFEDPHFSGDI